MHILECIEAKTYAVYKQKFVEVNVILKLGGISARPMFDHQ